MHGVLYGLPVIILVFAALFLWPRLSAMMKQGKPGKKASPSAKGKVDAKGKAPPAPPRQLKQLRETPKAPPPPPSLQALGQAKRLEQQARREGQAPPHKPR